MSDPIPLTVLCTKCDSLFSDVSSCEKHKEYCPGPITRDHCVAPLSPGVKAFRVVQGVGFICPVCWRYLSDNSALGILTHLNRQTRRGAIYGCRKATFKCPKASCPARFISASSCSLHIKRDKHPGRIVVPAIQSTSISESSTSHEADLVVGGVIVEDTVASSPTQADSNRVLDTPPKSMDVRAVLNLEQQLVCGELFLKLETTINNAPFTACLVDVNRLERMLELERRMPSEQQRLDCKSPELVGSGSSKDNHCGRKLLTTINGTPSDSPVKKMSRDQ